jgi:DNA repair protein RecO (recombination protein O)
MITRETALALVVRGSDWSETSRIATLFTRDFGKVRGLAKGGRRPKSQFEFAFDLLTVCQIGFIKKTTGGLELLTEAKLVEQFPRLRLDLKALYAGYYIAELLADGTQDYDPHPLLFDAALEALRGFQAEAPLLAQVSAFELVWLRELGYSPRLTACAVCNCELFPPPDLTARVMFSLEAGGVVCSDCQAEVRDRRSLSGSAWQTLRALATADARTVPELVASGRAEIRGLLGQAVSAVLGRRPRLLSYLDAG